MQDLLRSQAVPGQRLIVLLRQAGSAAALIPAIDDFMAAHQSPPPLILIWPQAIKTWHEVARAPGCMELLEVRSEAQAQRAFDAALATAGLVLTGTSAEAAADARYWRRARACGVASVAYLDQWVNIERRFPGNALSDWPGLLAVIDEHDRRAACAIAPVGVRVQVTGSPALAAIRQRVQGLRAEGVVADPRRIVFATEPHPDPDTYRRINGCCDEDSFELALRLVRRCHAGATLALRLHPRDCRERWLPRLPADIALDWDESSRADCLARAGRVYGMRSFFLLEAQAADVPVYSLQPGRKTTCPLTDQRMPVLTDEEAYAP